MDGNTSYRQGLPQGSPKIRRQPNHGEHSSPKSLRRAVAQGKRLGRPAGSNKDSRKKSGVVA